MKNKRCNLIVIIYNDLCCNGKIQLFLLLLIIISAISVVWITYQTRCIISNREGFILKKNSLECEWNELILEKELLTNYMRIEHIALDRLNMHHVDPVLKNIESQ